MDYWTLKRLALELNEKAAGRPVLVRAVDLVPAGIGLLLKSGERISCWEILNNPDFQWIRMASDWDEAPEESHLVRTFNRILTNSRIYGVTILGWDRVLHLQFRIRDSFFGTIKSASVFCEFTGRISNLLLCDEENIVLDQLRKTANNKPGTAYRQPGSTIKDAPGRPIDPFLGNPDELRRILGFSPQSRRELIHGISPMISKELQKRHQLDFTSDLFSVFRNLLEELKMSSSGGCTINIYLANDKLLAISPVTLLHLSEDSKHVSFKCVNDGFNYIFENLIRGKSIGQLKQQAMQKYRKEIARQESLLAEQARRIKEFEGGEKWLHFGNLLLREVKNLPPRVSETSIKDLETGEMLRISLNPEWTVPRNAQRFFQMYKKAKRGLTEAGHRKVQIDSRIAWLREQLWFVETADLGGDLKILISQLDERKKSGAKGRTRKEPQKGKKIPAVAEVDQCRFYAGRNGKQNHLVTFQVGKKGDIWFHANDVPGSHVVAKKISGGFTSEDLCRGAELAAYLSFSRNSGKVAVDYTDVANVRAIPGGEPGRVYYTHQKTLMVNPENAKKILKSSGK